MIRFFLYCMYIVVFALSGYVSFLGYSFMKSKPAVPASADKPLEVGPTSPIITLPDPTPVSPSESEGSLSGKLVPALSGLVLITVPFVSQAPFGNWVDIVNEEWCEEASILMAHAWATSTALSPEEADRQIKEISEYEKKALGTFVHTSLADTSETLRNYLSFSGFRLEENASRDDIITELRGGNIVIVPASGRALHNIFFTPPGPINHMLIIIGYDPETREFITNDPGTKNGASYRYKEDILYGAIWDYPTSPVDVVVPEVREKKPMLVISKIRS